MLILASASPRRKELLNQIGMEFSILVPKVEEYTAKDVEDPQELVWKNSRLKAEAVMALEPEHTVISADTVVALNGKIYGKPKSKEDAMNILMELSGVKHQVFTGVTIGKGGNLYSEVGVTEVAMKELSDEEIKAYIATGEPMDKAGAYGIQGYAAKFIKGINGCYFNVVGLPLNLLYELQKKVDDNYDLNQSSGSTGGGKA